MQRRYFLMGPAPLAVGRAPLSSPNNTVRVACVGLRGRGRDHIDAFLGLPGVQIAALCDVDDSILRKSAAALQDRSKTPPALFTDFRKLLADRSIDAVAIATPDHWHALQSVWACQAGKDVYLEKPGTHNMFEVRKVVEAARRHNRIVQHGTQSRSSPALAEAVRRMKEGLIGDVYMARGLCFNWRDTIGRAAPEPVPAGVDYDLWLGPASRRAFTRNRFHYNWHWFWEYGSGDIGNQGAHELDIARWGLGVNYPDRVSAHGGHFMFDDDQETPNTLTANFEFNSGGKKKLLVFEVRHWISNHEAGMVYPNTIGNVFYGSKGYLAIDGYTSYQTWLGKEQQPGPSASAAGDHFANFIGAVRSRESSDLTADIEQGAISTALIHLANISYRLGRELRFDAASYTCTGDDAANAMFTRAYRAPFEMPV
jgi:predicted dehydrogenase